jgi:glycerol-3-phosphate dehydrogenase
VEEFDLLVVGGGINGAGIARDAAGRGLSVLLVEKDDLAAHTSSASSKLIHGGLRYLEQFQFKLVRQSLAEREHLLRMAPHIVRPLRFIIPVTDSTRAAWVVRAGLLLYDHLARRTLIPGSGFVRLDDAVLVPEAKRALTYWDCQVQDARLVVLNALDAAERGATILPRTELLSARREEHHWIARIHSIGHERSVKARALVNAAGPWAGELFERISGVKPRHSIRLVKGSHIVLPKLYAGEHAYLLQNADGRVVFAIPFEGSFTLVGTTEVDWAGPRQSPEISDDEVQYLLGTIRRYFAAPVSPSDIVWTYSGIRALVDDGSSNPSKVSRDYVLDVDSSGAPLLSVFGGKITTYRHLAEQAVDRLARYLPVAKGRWTEGAPLPGGDILELDVDAYAKALAERSPELPRDLISRFVGTYGTRTERMLEGVRTVADLGEHFGAGLYAQEIDYLVAHEWARTPEDILFRRTKLGLHVSPTIERLTAYISARVH